MILVVMVGIEPTYACLWNKPNYQIHTTASVQGGIRTPMFTLWELIYSQSASPICIPAHKPFARIELA